MKRFIQYTAILGAVFTVLGFGTAGAARMNGARWSQMHIERQSMVIPAIGHHRVHSHDVPFGAETGTSAGEGIKTFSAVHDLSVSLESGKLAMEYGDTDEIQVVCGEESAFGEDVWSYVEGGEMTLEIYGRENPGKKTEVRMVIPRGHVFGDVEMAVGAGSCTVPDLDAQELDIDLAAGEIILENMRVSSLSVDCAAGNVSCSGQIFGDVEVDCAAGNVALLLNHDKNEFSYELEGAGGSIEIGDESFSGLAFSREFNYHAGKSMELQTVTGSIRVEFSPDALLQNKKPGENEAEKMMEYAE